MNKKIKKEKHTQRFSFALNNEKDKELIEWINKQPNKSEYIKRLVRERIGLNKHNH